MTKEEAIRKLSAMCSRREYCSGQILGYIRKWSVGSADSGPQFDMNSSGEIMDYLVRYGFIDDMRFIRAFARDKARFSGWGKEKILFKLRSLGFSSPGLAEEVDSALADTDMEGRLKELLRRKWQSIGKREEPLANKRAKLLRFAIGRGYDYDSAAAAIKSIMAEQ